MSMYASVMSWWLSSAMMSVLASSTASSIRDRYAAAIRCVRRDRDAVAVCASGPGRAMAETNSSILYLLLLR